MEACPAYALRALELLEDGGYEAWVVGGWVRDALRGLPGHDVDVTTAAPWRETERVLRAAGVTVHETGTRHGTVTAVIDGRPVEITTYRVEGAYTDHRHPDEVRFVSDVREDLARRDFTINAMAWHPERGLLDPFGGERDLARGVIRAVGEPRRRFGEDALRVLRAVRFACRMGFSVESATQEALVACAPELVDIAQERIGQELDGIARSGHAGWALAREPEVMRAAVPELGDAEAMGRAAATCRLAEAYSGGVAPRTLRWAAMLSEVPDGGRAVDRILRRVAIPLEVARPVSALVRLRDARLEPTRPGVRRLLGKLAGAAPDREPALAFQLLDLQRAASLARGELSSLPALDACGAVLRGELAAGPVFKLSQLAVGGGDLIRELGMAPGPQIGRTLSRLLDAVVAGEAPNERAALLELARTSPSGS